MTGKRNNIGSPGIQDDFRVKSGISHKHEMFSQRSSTLGGLHVDAVINR